MPTQKQFNKYRELREQYTRNANNLFTECGVFWAFSRAQFEEGVKKHPLKEGEKYAQTDCGGYFPSSNFDKLEKGMEELQNRLDEQITSLNLQETEIVAELINQDAFAVFSIESTVKLLLYKYSREKIRKIFYKHLNKYAEC